MIQDLDKIKTLLATYKQIEEKLGQINEKGECVYCIEGIFALTSDLIESIDTQSGEICFYNHTTDENYDSEIDYVDFPNGIPDVVNFKLLIDNRKRIQLNKEQLNKLTRIAKREGGIDITWIQLNDDIKVTFKQFSILLDIINDTQLSN